MASRRAAVVAAGTIGSEHLIDQTFGPDVLNLRKDRRFFLLRVETLANSVVDESHKAGRDNDAAEYR